MTSHEQTKIKTPPNADEILQQFSTPFLKASRVLLLLGLRVTKWVRRVKWNTYGNDAVQVENAPFIFASNHQSHVDTHVILDTLPKEIRSKTAVAAAFDHFADAEGTSKKKRVIQFLVAASWHAFGIERVNSPLSSIRTMQNLLTRGWSIVIYPEGTRSRTGDIQPFKAGLALIAKKSRCPVIPVCVLGGKEVLPEATYIPRAGTISISYGPVLHFRDGESNIEFMARVETEVRKLAK